MTATADLCDEYGDQLQEIEISFGGVGFRPGDLLFSDEDGIVVKAAG